MLKGALAVVLALFDFAKGVSSGHAEPTLWLEGAKRQVAVKS